MQRDRTRQAVRRRGLPRAARQADHLVVTALSLQPRLRELHALYAASLAPVWDPKRGLTVKVKAGGGKLWPERTKCKACRKDLGGEPVIGMFCSYRCAGLPAPGTDPEKAPRECRRAARPHEPGEWLFKKRFYSEADALQWLQSGTDVYRCSWCFALHTGRSSPDPARRSPAGPAADRIAAAVPVPASRAGGPPGAGSAAERAGERGERVLAACVDALLEARGVSRRTAQAVAEAERDVRAVLGALSALR